MGAEGRHGGCPGTLGYRDHGGSRTAAPEGAGLTQSRLSAGLGEAEGNGSSDTLERNLEKERLTKSPTISPPPLLLTCMSPSGKG